MFKLRSYQQRAVDLALSCLDQAESACPVVLAACGAGKSLIGSAIADALISRSRSAGRVLVVTHRAELVRQNHDKLPAHLRGSFFSASIGRKDSTGDVIFANIQSIQKQWHKLPKLQAILIDECHVAGKMYAEFIDNVKKVSPHVRVIGLTATNFDGRGVWLHMLEKHRIFTGVSSEVGIGELLVAGHLCPLTAYSGATRLDVTGVSIDARTGDFQQNQLQAAVDVPELVAQCAAEIKAIFAARNSVLVFCSGVEHAKHVAAALGGEVVLGNTPKLERARLIETFRAGRLKYLCSVDVLTTGFDSQNVDGIANLRPSRSPLVWLQLCGRGMRPHPTKNDCLVADFTDNTDFFGPIDEIEGRPPKTKTGDAPTKVCDPGCFSIILAGLRVCPHCGMEFEFQSHEQQFDPETGLLISGVVKNEDGTKTYPVSDVTYEVRNTRAGSEALVCYFHAPGRKTPVAEDWMNMWHHKRSVASRDMEKWLRRSLTPGVPSNAQEALARAELGGMKVPKSVTVRPGSPFPVRFST